MLFDENGMVIATDGLEVPPPWEVRESSKFGGQFPILSDSCVLALLDFPISPLLQVDSTFTTALIRRQSGP